MTNTFHHWWLCDYINSVGARVCDWRPCFVIGCSLWCLHSHRDMWVFLWHKVVTPCNHLRHTVSSRSVSGSLLFRGIIVDQTLGCCVSHSNKSPARYHRATNIYVSPKSWRNILMDSLIGYVTHNPVALTHIFAHEWFSSRAYFSLCFCVFVSWWEGPGW